MHCLRAYIAFLFFAFLSLPALRAQNQQRIDSLQRVLLAHAEDTLAVSALDDLAWEYRSSDASRATDYANRALKLSEKLDHKRGVAFSIYLLGLINDYAGNYEQALGHYTTALELYIANRDRKGMASTYNNMGAVYSFQGNYDKAIEYYLKSLDIKEQLGDKKAIASTLNNIGAVHESQRKFDKALDYYLQSLEMKEKLADKKPLATSYSNVGGIYQMLGNNDKALEYFEKSVSIYKQSDDHHGLALTYNSLGALCIAMGERERAIRYQEMAYAIQENTGDKLGMCYSLLGLGDIYLKTRDYALAVTYLQKGIKLAQEIGALKEQEEGYLILAKVYEEQNDHRNALASFRMHSLLKDSISDTENNKAVLEMQTRYETAKKEKEIERLNKERQLKAREMEQGRMIRNFSLGLAGLGLVLAVVIFRGYQSKKRSNVILSAQRDELDMQKKLIEVKSKEISESIEYAKYIQDATLPSLKIQDLLPASFLLYMPKDVVSGDFYWLEQDEEAVYIVVADCTGHGVPGAFMSMIGTMLLNEIYNAKQVRRPAEMLMQLNRLLRMSLKQHDESMYNRNGMDIVACRLVKSTKMLQVASANRPVWIIHRGSKVVTTIKPDKIAIGGMTPSDFSFTTSQVQLHEGDQFYLFSDGYADQFGGTSGKKMMTGKFKEFLLSVESLPMQQQKAAIEKFFTEWKGGQQQVDDVLVAGVRVSWS